MTRVLLVDDQAVVRAGLRTILETDEAIEVVGEANDGQEAVTLTQALDPDVVMMDIRMPVLDGIKATERLISTGTQAKVLMLTTTGSTNMSTPRCAPARPDFMLKTEPPARLCEAVHVVAAGDALLGSETTRLLIERYLSEPQPVCNRRRAWTDSPPESRKCSSSWRTAAPTKKSQRRCSSNGAR